MLASAQTLASTRQRPLRLWPGVVIVLLLVTRRVTLKSYIPFGPFLIIGTLAAVVAIFFSKRVAQMITRPITRAATVSDGIAQGNLAQKIDVNHHGGELGLLLNSIQNTIYRLRELIQAVRDREIGRAHV